MADKPPDLPSSCAVCIFVRQAAPDAFRCHNHSPGTTRGEYVVAHWPPVLGWGRCVRGSVGNNPEHKRLVACGGCGAWSHPVGGLKPERWLMGDHPAEWWAESGYCLASAPFPSDNDDPTEHRWLVTHRTGGCGDGLA